eukprot:TRINITY_DN12132_c0_g1_i1.p1 TRINITY_DN12132_c0_g1~~TRINITY_DN12132_c0_g1_i1.p1  ORF type:complete len:481 (-),score=93.16 TRINITY_DN12132_c0_g1_i1:242-1684(-)
MSSAARRRSSAVGTRASSKPMRSENQAAVEAVSPSGLLDPAMTAARSLIARPHTITLLLVLVAAFLHFTPVEPSATDIRVGAYYGARAATVFFLFFCALHLPDGIMRRPHVVFWRVVLGLSVAYAMFLSFLLYLDLESVRSVFFFLDPRLSASQEEKAYDTGCDVYTPNDPRGPFANVAGVWGDEFVLAHLLGYVCKAVMIRDWRVVTLCSLVFELLEVALQHVLPNFRECWWDHIIIDVLMCNAAGTAIGIAIVKWFGGARLDWVPAYKAPRHGFRATVATFIRERFTPLEFVVYRWEMFSTFRRFLYVWFLVGAINLVDLHAFYLKFLVGIPPPHPFNALRVTLWWLMACAALREYYHYAIHADVHALGPAAWVCCACVALEIVLIQKLSLEVPALWKPWPYYIIYPALLWLLLLAVWMVLYFGDFVRGAGRRYLHNFFFLSAVPLVALFVMGSPGLEWGKEPFRQLCAGLGLPVHDP